MSNHRITVGQKDVMDALRASGKPLGESGILLRIMRELGIEQVEESGKSPSAAIRRPFNMASLRRSLVALESGGKIEVASGEEWEERGVHWYDQRPIGKYWAVRDASYLAGPEQPVEKPVEATPGTSWAATRRRLSLRLTASSLSTAGGDVKADAGESVTSSTRLRQASSASKES